MKKARLNTRAIPQAVTWATQTIKSSDNQSNRKQSFLTVATSAVVLNSTLAIMSMNQAVAQSQDLSGGENWREAENPLDYNRAPTRATTGGTYDPIGRRIFVSASMDF